MNLTFNPGKFHFAFGTHDQVTIEAVAYRPLSRNETGYVMLAADSSGFARSFTHEQISRLGTAGRIYHQPNFFRPEETQRRLMTSTVLISQLAKKPKARLSKRAAYVEAFLAMEEKGEIKRTDASIEANMRNLLAAAVKIVKNLNPLNQVDISPSIDLTEEPSPRTLRRWIKSSETSGTGGLGDSMQKRGNRNMLMCPEAQGLLMKEVRGYLSGDQPSIGTIHENVQIAFSNRNAERSAAGLGHLTCPSKETVRRAILTLDPYTVMVARKGLDEARKKFRPVGQGLNLTRPMERVEIDEWTIDIISFMYSTGLIDYLTEEERLACGLDGKKGRWTLTVAICATTRCIVGMTLSASAKGTAAIKTLEMLMSDKGQWADAVGALGSWDMHGTPEMIVTDCGPAFQSEEFRFACSDLGITTQRAIAGFPELRARIERLFRTMVLNLLPRLTGRTFSDVISKGDANPEKRAALTVEDLIFALVRWTVDIYHNTPHDGLDGETPLSCWRRLEAKWGVRNPPDMRRQRLVLGSRLVRVLDKEGIRVLNLLYHSPRLADWMNHKDPYEVDVRWHPNDIGAIEVRLGAEWFEVPTVAEGFVGVTAQTWLATSRELQATDPARKAYDRSVIHKAIQAITERNAAAIMTAKLLVPDWSPERIAREEKRNLISFHVSGPKEPKKPGAALGQSVLPPEEGGEAITAESRERARKSPNRSNIATKFIIEE